MNPAMMMIVFGGGILMLCCVCFVGLLLMSGDPAADGGQTGADPVIGEIAPEIVEDIPSVKEFTPPGCVTLTDNADGTGGQNQFCLDGRDYFEIKNMKNYGFNDKISAVGVGEGVAMTIFENENQGGQSREIHGPVFENLADTWKNDKASSMKMWKK